MKFIYLLSILFLFGCNNSEIKDIREKYNNGNVKRIYYYKSKEDKLINTYREEVFYKSGKIDHIGNYINDNREGVWKWWYEDGKLKDKCTFLKGNEIDTIFHWYNNGNPKEISIIKNGIQDKDASCSSCCNSTVMLYYENGNNEEYSTRIANLLNDTFKSWYDNGKPKEIAYYINDKLEGTRKKYNDKGWWLTRTYKNGICSGPTTEYQIDSITNEIRFIKGQYENNNETGKWIWYNKDSVITQIRIYNNGKIISKKNNNF